MGTKMRSLQFHNYLRRTLSLVHIICFAGGKRIVDGSVVQMTSWNGH
jgi:hypothetical protein